LPIVTEACRKLGQVSGRRPGLTSHGALQDEVLPRHRCRPRRRSSRRKLPARQWFTCP
jgi:hypothetical protein